MTPEPILSRMPGIDRLIWAACSVGWAIVWWILIPLVVAVADAVGLRSLTPIAVLGHLLLFTVVLLWLISRRLVHVGHSPWLAFLALLPGANLWIGILCLIAPAGYARHRRLDRVGTVVAVLCLLLALLLILSAIG